MPAHWIDAHHHLWHYRPQHFPWITPGMQTLQRDFLVHDLEAVTAQNNVTGTVAIQSRQSLEETDWLLDLAQNSPLIRGVVGWLPLTERSLEAHLDRLRSRPLLKGLRHILHDETDPLYMLREDFNAGIRLLTRHGLRYDLLIFPLHLPQTIQFVDRHPNQVFVLDHLAKPRIAASEIEPWRRCLLALSERPNVFCKLSGMVTEAVWSQWTPATLQPYFDTVLAAFSPARLMFGSDWPVLTLAASYSQWLATVDALLASLSSTEADAIRHDTAIQAYGL